MNEALIGFPDIFIGAIYVIHILEKVKASKASGYGYCVYCDTGGYPNGILQTTLQKITTHYIFCDVVSLDVQKKSTYHCA